MRLTAARDAMLGVVGRLGRSTITRQAPGSELPSSGADSEMAESCPESEAEPQVRLFCPLDGMSCSHPVRRSYGN